MAQGQEGVYCPTVCTVSCTIRERWLKTACGEVSLGWWVHLPIRSDSIVAMGILRALRALDVSCLIALAFCFCYSRHAGARKQTGDKNESSDSCARA